MPTWPSSSLCATKNRKSTTETWQSCTDRQQQLASCSTLMKAGSFSDISETVTYREKKTWYYLNDLLLLPPPPCSSRAMS